MKSMRIRAFLLALVLLFTAVFAVSCGGQENIPSTDPATVSSEMPEADPITVTVGATGDYLIHTPILRAYAAKGYDFSDIFTYVKDCYNTFDYFLGNLEVTFGGDYCDYVGNGSTFNCPDTLANALLDAGVDRVLTANNHSYDTGSTGLRRTRDVLTEKGLPFIGTHYDGDKRYAVVDVGGIKIGMINYTYQTGDLTDYSLNERSMLKGDEAHVNMFSENNLEDFYADMSSQMQAMYAEGAEAIMLFIHWGQEYHREQTDVQSAMAQRLCDLGVDVIVGGHPHVVEPIDVLTSAVSGKQTVCLYSTGNAVSNQRVYEMTNTAKAFPCVAEGCSEDGVIFSVSFTKAGNGSVSVSAIDAIPTWVNLYSDGNGTHFQIVPLANGTDLSSFGNLAESGAVTAAEKSRQRTASLLAPGLEKFKTVYQTTDTRPHS